jgi:hypothetical protein
LKKFSVSDFWGGWLVGDFSPSVIRTSDFEFGVKGFMSGATEPSHYQVVAHELSVVVSGECFIGGVHLGAGDALLIFPGEHADFLAISDCTVAVLKWPSLPLDKILL